MATRPLEADSALVTPPAFAVPPGAAAVARILRRYEPGQLAGFIEVAIGLLDVMDGDPDLEQTGAEDDTVFFARAWDGPGCPIGDPAEVDDPAEDDDADEDDDPKEDADGGGC